MKTIYRLMETSIEAKSQPTCGEFLDLDVEPSEIATFTSRDEARTALAKCKPDSWHGAFGFDGPKRVYTTYYVALEEINEDGEYTNTISYEFAE